MEAYKAWVRTNRDYVHSLESLANGLTWLLPERFSESEIGPEAVTTFLGIITAINAHIIDTTPAWIAQGSRGPSSFPYALCISAIKDLESLVEVVAQQIYGDDNKWSFIAAMEAAKVLVRLALFRSSGYKMLLHGGEASNVEDESDASSSQQKSFVKAGGPERSYHGQQNPWHLEGKALSALSRFGEHARVSSSPTWLQKIQHQYSALSCPMPVVERPTLSTILSERGLCGGLFVMGILSLATTPWHSRKKQMVLLSGSENDEVKRRKLLWALYLMRDPFFSKYTRQKLESTEKLMEPVPIIGLLTGKLIELITGAQTRYTYVSGS